MLGGARGRPRRRGSTRDADRVRQLVAGHAEQLLADQLRGEERLGLIGDHAVGVVVRTVGQPGLELVDERVDPVAGERRARARRRRSRRPAAGRPRRGARRPHAVEARVDLVHARGSAASPTACARSAMNRSPAPSGAFASTTTQIDVDLAQCSPGPARWSARPAPCAACADPGVSSSTSWLRRRRAHAADRRARRLRARRGDRDLRADDRGSRASTSRRWVDRRA